MMFVIAIILGLAVIGSSVLIKGVTHGHDHGQHYMDK